MVLKKITAEEAVPLRAAVLRPGRPLEAARFPKDEIGGHFGMYDGEMLVAVGTIYPDACDSPFADAAMRRPDAWRLRGMATDPGYRGRGCGAQVLRACLEHARANSNSQAAALVWANARTGAMKFYLRNGFERLGDEYDVPGVGPHYLIRIALS